MSHCKNSARDTAIGKRWICSAVEGGECSAVAVEYGVVSFCELGDFIC